MKHLFRIPTPLLALVLATAACGRSPAPTAITVAAAPATAEPRAGITVTGTATMEVVPDVADLRMTLTAEASRPGAAAKAVRARQAEVTKQLAALVSKPDVTLSYVSVNPLYDEKSGRLRAYQAAITMNLSTGDFDQVAELMEVGAQAGGTQMSTSFRTRDVTGLKAKVRDQALAAVKAKAEQTAKGLGVKLGAIVSISEDTGLPWGSQTANIQAYMPAPADTAPTGLRPDAQTMTLTITVGYQLPGKA